MKSNTSYNIDIPFRNQHKSLTITERKIFEVLIKLTDPSIAKSICQIYE